MNEQGVGMKYTIHSVSQKDYTTMFLCPRIERFGGVCIFIAQI